LLQQLTHAAHRTGLDAVGEHAQGVIVGHPGNRLMSAALNNSPAARQRSTSACTSTVADAQRVEGRRVQMRHSVVFGTVRSRHAHKSLGGTLIHPELEIDPREKLSVPELALHFEEAADQFG